MSGDESAPTVVGRYSLHQEIAAGGMATVHLGRLVGGGGFSKTVAIKRLHPQLAKDPELAAMLLDEARLASRIHHRNVVATLDVVALDQELLVVMEYIEGETLARLLASARKQGRSIEPVMACSIVCGVLDGLHAAHEAKDEASVPLGIVHRDVSPQNILVGVDGTPRVLDFGIALALRRSQATRDGRIKGKLSYMAPEQLDMGSAGRASDIYSASVVLWEALTSRRLFDAENDFALADKIRRGVIAPPSAFSQSSEAIDAVVRRGLAIDPKDRFATALEMSEALERAAGLASPRQVGALVTTLSSESLLAREKAIEAMESQSGDIAFGASSNEPDRSDELLTQIMLEGRNSTTAVGDTTNPPNANVPPGRAARAWPVGAAIAAALVLAALGFRAATRPTSVHAAGGDVRIAQSPVTPPSIATSPLTADSIEASSAPLSSTADMAVPSGAPKAAIAAPPTAEVGSRLASAPAPARPSMKSPNQAHRPCDNPFQIDARGIKRIKRECL